MICGSGSRLAAAAAAAAYAIHAENRGRGGGGPGICASKPSGGREAEHVSGTPFSGGLVWRSSNV